jgi:predicted nucleotidyltransferase
MIPAILAHQPEIARLCDRYGVRHLEVFGSASVEMDDASACDIDLLVDFDRDSRQRPCPAISNSKATWQRCLGSRSTLSN